MRSNFACANNGHSCITDTDHLRSAESVCTVIDPVRPIQCGVAHSLSGSGTPFASLRQLWFQHPFPKAEEAQNQKGPTINNEGRVPNTVRVSVRLAWFLAVFLSPSHFLSDTGLTHSEKSKLNPVPVSMNASPTITSRSDHDSDYLWGWTTRNLKVRLKWQPCKAKLITTLVLMKMLAFNNQRITPSSSISCTIQKRITNTNQ